MKRLLLINVCLSILVSSLAFAQPVEVSNFKYKFLGYTSTSKKYVELSWKMDVENVSNKTVEGFASFEFLDKDGFSLGLGCQDGSKVILSPGEKITIRGTIEPEVQKYKQFKKVSYGFVKWKSW